MVELRAMSTREPFERSGDLGWWVTGRHNVANAPLRVRCKHAVSMAMLEAGHTPPRFQLDDYDYPDEATLLCFTPDSVLYGAREAYEEALQRAIEMTAERIGWPY
jgi:hypothetical protein